LAGQSRRLRGRAIRDGRERHLGAACPRGRRHDPGRARAGGLHGGGARLPGAGDPPGAARHLRPRPRGVTAGRRRVEGRRAAFSGGAAAARRDRGRRGEAALAGAAGAGALGARAGLARCRQRRAEAGRGFSALLAGLATPLLAAAPGSDVSALQDALRRTVTAVERSGLRHAELWSYRIDAGGGRLLPERYGTSSDVQLWSLTDLAVEYLLARLPQP